MQECAIPFEKNPPRTQTFSQWTIPSKFNKIIIIRDLAKNRGSLVLKRLSGKTLRLMLSSGLGR